MEIIIVSAASVFMGMCIASIIILFHNERELKKLERMIEELERKKLVHERKHLNSVEEIDL